MCFNTIYKPACGKEEHEMSMKVLCYDAKRGGGCCSKVEIATVLKVTSCSKCGVGSKGGEIASGGREDVFYEEWSFDEVFGETDDRKY